MDGDEPALVENNTVMVEGRLSIREDEETKIVANKISNFGEQKQNKFVLDITDATEEQKYKLKGAIKYFSGDRNNVPVFVKINEELKPCGGIYLTEQVSKIFKDILGEKKVYSWSK